LTGEQAALIKKAEKSLEAAKLLQSKGFFEFAVSRAYYTMFYLAEAYLLIEEVAFSKHSAVIAAFGKDFASTSKIPNKFHRYIIDAESARNLGDYDIMKGIEESKSEKHIKHAEEFLKFSIDFLDSVK
jgi:uncharacterized protein (UPF0332 family)